MTRPGYLVEARYRLDRHIAAGGAGQVWRATDLLLERPVAVKVLRPEYADHPDTLERFRQEARNAGLLTHPHVAQVFDYGPGGAGCPPYLVLEFVDGPSLADVLAAGPVPPAVALDVVAQTADGLSAAHRAGLVHRDVKPGNILIGPGGQVKITDFGIAHAAGQAPVTGPGLVMGTAQYMAPERIAGGPGTPASDLYALGIVLHECLLGVPPFEGTSADLMAAHLYLPLPPLPPDVPAEVYALAGALTDKNPARRISDAGELAEVAARMRDALAPGYLVPSARAQHYGPGAADPVPSRSGAWRGSGLAELAAGTAPGFALGPAAGEAGSPEPGTEAGSPGPDTHARRRRRRAVTIAVAAVLWTAAALVVLLTTGVFRTASSNGPPSSPTSAGATTPGPRLSPSTRPANATSRPGRTGTNAAVPGTTSPPATRSSTKASPGTSQQVSPSTSPSTSPSASPSGSPPGSPSGSPSPTRTACVLGVCL